MQWLLLGGTEVVDGGKWFVFPGQVYVLGGWVIGVGSFREDEWIDSGF